MPENGYDRDIAVRYAMFWALRRNPEYTDFQELGGDCTNFVSQCVYAGGGVMNFTPIFGWYYISSFDRTASWSGVEFFYNFITQNDGPGPYGIETSKNNLEVGDVIQLALDNEETFQHSLFVTRIIPGPFERILICAHSRDAFMRPLSTYSYKKIRYIHIEGVRPQNSQFPIL